MNTIWNRVGVNLSFVMLPGYRDTSISYINFFNKTKPRF